MKEKILGTAGTSSTQVLVPHFVGGNCLYKKYDHDDKIPLPSGELWYQEFLQICLYTKSNPTTRGGWRAIWIAHQLQNISANPWFATQNFQQ